MEMRELEKAAEAGRGAGLIGEGRGREEGLFCKDVLQVEESCLLQWTCAVFVFTKCLWGASKKAASAEVYTEFRAQQAFSGTLEASIWLLSWAVHSQMLCVQISSRYYGKKKGSFAFWLSAARVICCICYSSVSLTYSLVPTLYFTPLFKLKRSDNWLCRIPPQSGCVCLNLYGSI